MSEPSFPIVPPIHTNPLSPELQNFVMTAYSNLQGGPGYIPSQLALMVAIFRDGMVFPFSGLNNNGQPVAKDYNLPVNVGKILYSTNLSVISAEMEPGVVKASFWYKQGGVHKCNGG